ncbi:MAG: nitroreductase family protein [Anaerolineales bacterium]
MHVSEAIQTKRATRTFKQEPLPEDAVRAILNAGRRAQSAKNMQPWNFIAIQDKNRLEDFSECGTYAGHLAGAALGIAIITPPFTERFSIMFDAGQAAAYMQLAAWELGIGSVPATIYEREQARALLGFPEDRECYIALSFGYPADEKALTRPPQKGGRRPFQDTVHWETWDN